MTADDFLTLLRLPESAILRRRVTKTDFIDQVHQSADRRLITQRVESLTWLAAVNPDTTGLPAGEVDGLAVVAVGMRGDRATPPPRLVQLLHRVVPDPMLLVSTRDRTVITISVKPYADGVFLIETIDEPPAAAAASLAVDRAASITELRDRWIDAVLGWAIHDAVGKFPVSRGDHQRRIDKLAEIKRLDAQIKRDTPAARRERQLARRAELNATIQAARRHRQTIVEELVGT